jgi:putative membrane protein
MQVRWAMGAFCALAAGAMTACGAAIADDETHPAALALDDTTLPQEELTDAQIVEVTRLANEGEMQAGWIALVKATTREAADFARMMATEHLSANLQLRDLSRAEQTGTQTSATSTLLVEQALEINAELEAANGRAFDLLYLETQVTMHGAVLTLVDTRLIPQADNAALRAYLTAIRADVARHLEEAERRLQEVEARGTGAAP